MDVLLSSVKCPFGLASLVDIGMFSLSTEKHIANFKMSLIYYNQAGATVYLKTDEN